mmetsp:Transcript_18969/g.73073  ORF Transcript_18969/g.73073 Transcript_18969/m.73073 type:complete len:235 (+) Transcript_18969:2675-3379(+)
MSSLRSPSSTATSASGSSTWSSRTSTAASTAKWTPARTSAASPPSATSVNSTTSAWSTPPSSSTFCTLSSSRILQGTMTRGTASLFGWCARCSPHVGNTSTGARRRSDWTATSCTSSSTTSRAPSSRSTSSTWLLTHSTSFGQSSSDSPSQRRRMRQWRSLRPCRDQAVHSRQTQCGQGGSWSLRRARHSTTKRRRRRRKRRRRQRKRSRRCRAWSRRRTTSAPRLASTSRASV